MMEMTNLLSSVQRDLNKQWFSEPFFVEIFQKYNFFQPRLLRLMIGLRVVDGYYLNMKLCNKNKQLKTRNRGLEILSIQSLQQP